MNPRRHTPPYRVTAGTTTSNSATTRLSPGSGVNVRFNPPADPPEPEGGVREPRRPLPTRPSPAAAAVELVGASA